MFCGKYFVCSGTCVSIIIKRKYVNYGNISDICNKFSFTTNYTYFDTIYLKNTYYNF